MFAKTNFLVGALLGVAGLANAAYDPLNQAQPINLAAANILVKNEYLPFEAGWGTADDGLVHISGQTYMRGVTGEMMDWWFGFVNNTERYQWWHPRDHVHLEWYPPKNGSAGDYIGGWQLVKEYIGGDLTSLNITFRSPGDFFGPTWKEDFKANNYSTAICADVALYEFNTGLQLPVGHLIHMMHNEPDGSRMRSRFWLGDNPYLPKAVIRPFIPQKLITGLSKHCNEEMAILASVLPQKWREYSDAGKAGKVTGFDNKNITARNYGGPAST